MPLRVRRRRMLLLADMAAKIRVCSAGERRALQEEREFEFADNVRWHRRLVRSLQGGTARRAQSFGLTALMAHG